MSRSHPALVLSAAVVLAGAAIFGWALPRAIAFFPQAQSSFWAVSVLALLVEAPPFVSARSPAWHSRTTLSVCFTFAVFLLWGAGPAIVVQATASAVRAASQRLTIWQAAVLTGRLLCSLGAAEAALVLIGGLPEPSAGAGPVALSVVVPVLSWALVSFGLSAFWQTALGLGENDQARTALRAEVVGTTATLLFVFPLLPAFDRFGWWAVLFLLPLLAWNGLLRQGSVREEAMRYEPVTGVLNRRGLLGSFEELTATDVIEGESGRLYGVVLVNIDTVEIISRELGRDLYETLVAAAAQRLVGEFGQPNVGRFTGEGFVVIRPDVDVEQAEPAAARVVAVLMPPFEVEGIRYSLNPTAGIALAPEHGNDLATLVGLAEIAMTRARRRGEPAQRYVPEASAVLARRRALLTDLSSALHDPRRHPEVQILYQPQVEVGTGRLAGVEALTRWTSPRLGRVPTEELIAAIEPTDVMHRLTAHVIDRVVAQLATWDRDEGLRVHASVNASVLDLYQAGFAEEVRRVLQRHSVPPDQLTIEITEGAVTSDPDRVVRAAGVIRDLGVGISLDDFGTGYASLQQLRLLPLTEVKIDRVYVAAITADRNDLGIVASVHQFARSTELALVAEGVEDAETDAALARMPGVIGQGYYYARPLPADEIPGFASEHAVPRAARRPG